MHADQHPVRLRIRVTGRVHGIFYRASTPREAATLGLVGWVRNCRDGSVEITAEGPQDVCGTLLEYCRTGPPAARVDAIETEWLEATGQFDGFEVRY